MRKEATSGYRAKAVGLALRVGDLFRQWPRRFSRVAGHLRQGLAGWDVGRLAEHTRPVPSALNKGRIARDYFPARQDARREHSSSYVTDEQRSLAGKEAVVFPRYLVPKALGAVADHGVWWCELVLLLLDLAGLPELYETAADWIKFPSRPLRSEEEALLRPLFGDQLPYRRIRIDERARWGPRQWRICYVSFFHINSWGPMDQSILVHEAVHVWQFWNLGSIYIPRALRAQRSPAGYDYGGAGALYRAREQGRPLRSFNLEQQADIVADYFRLKQGRSPCWGAATPADLPVYQHYVRQLTFA